MSVPDSEASESGHRCSATHTTMIGMMHTSSSCLSIHLPFDPTRFHAPLAADARLAVDHCEHPHHRKIVRSIIERMHEMMGNCTCVFSNIGPITVSSRVPAPQRHQLSLCPQLVGFPGFKTQLLQQLKEPSNNC